jgi:mono/diheme cytochrome c family protein
MDERFSRYSLIGLIITLVTLVLFIGYVFAEPGRLQADSEQVAEHALETGEELFAENCVSCHGAIGEGTDIAPSLSDMDFLKQASDNFLFATIVYGRRPRADMPAWGIDGGGPFTNEEVNHLVAFLRNWEDNPPEAPEVLEGAIGTDMDTELPPGDAANGKALYTSLGCIGCHNGTVAPQAADTAAQASTRREGYSPETYIRESIVLPSAFVVEGFQDVMIKNFGDRMMPQDVADIIAYILSSP